MQLLLTTEFYFTFSSALATGLKSYSVFTSLSSPFLVPLIHLESLMFSAGILTALGIHIIWYGMVWYGMVRNPFFSLSLSLSLSIYIYIYILKRHYKEIEKSILLHKRMMVKKLYIDIYENLKSPYISILTG